MAKQKSTFPSSPSKLPFMKEAEKFFRTMKKPTLKHILSWESNFQALLDDKNGRAKLREFMKSEYSEENLDFFLECEEFMKTTDEKKRKNKARKIYNDFISSDADKEINVDSETRCAITRRITSAPADIFTEAQRRIYILMEKDIYPRFLRSTMMKSLKEQLSMELPNSDSRSSSIALPGQLDEITTERIHSAPSRLHSTAKKSTSLDLPSADEMTTVMTSVNNKASSSNYQLKSSDEHLTISRV